MSTSAERIRIHKILRPNLLGFSGSSRWLQPYRAPRDCPSMISRIPKFPPKSSISSISRRCLCSSSVGSASSADGTPAYERGFHPGPAPSETKAQKLERIADEILDLYCLELNDFNILLRYRLGQQRYGSPPWMPGGASSSPSPAPASEAAKPAEKSTVDVKLEQFDAASKLKIVKEVRTITALGLKEAKDLVDSAPVVVKKQIPKEEADAIVAKLKELGATVVLE